MTYSYLGMNIILWKFLEKDHVKFHPADIWPKCKKYKEWKTLSFQTY